MSEENGIISRSGKRAKLENPARVAELNPAGTLRSIGFHAGQSLCDIGAGSGLFSIAAAELGASDVWAVDTDADVLADLKQRTGELSNLHVLPVKGCAYPLADASADWILLATVLHEIRENRAALFEELRRILKPGGSLCLIEFIKAPTPMGPPPVHRLGAGEAEQLLAGAGFTKSSERNLGENLYCQTYRISSR